jgi:hypothetical protein
LFRFARFDVLAGGLDAENGDDAVVVEHVPSGVGDVGAAREAEGVDRQVAEAGPAGLIGSLSGNR